VSIRQLSKDIRLRSEMFAEVVSACSTLLKYAPEAKESKEYVLKRMSRYSMDKFHIGYFPDDSNLNLLYDIVDKDTIRQLRLVYTKRELKRGYVEEEDKGFFNRHQVIFPFTDEYGNIIALAGRTLLSDKKQEELDVSKYKNTIFNKSLHLFGLHKAKNAIQVNDYAFVVEGQMDCITCHANGIHNVVAMTCSSLSRYQVYLLKKMTNTLYLLFDNDSAGNKAFHKAYKQYSNRVNIKRLKIPNDFKDIDQCLREGGECDVFDMLNK